MNKNNKKRTDNYYGEAKRKEEQIPRSEGSGA